jgi:PilZ domain
MEENNKERGEKRPRVGIAKLEKEIMPAKGGERRMYPRFLLNLPIEYSRLDSPISHSSRTVNASEGGLMIYLHEGHEVGQNLSVKIFFSFGSDLHTIETTVQVMWADEKLGEGGNFRHGVRFVDATSGDVQKFRGFLNSISPSLVVAF